MRTKLIHSVNRPKDKDGEDKTHTYISGTQVRKRCQWTSWREEIAKDKVHIGQKA